MKLMSETVSKSTIHVTLTSCLSMIDDYGSCMRLIVDIVYGWSLRETELRIDSLLANVALLYGVNEPGFYLCWEPSLIDRLSFYLWGLWLSSSMCSRVLIFSIIVSVGFILTTIDQS